jgi:hypothetical protein
MNQWLKPLVPAISTQAGYTVADLLGKLIGKLFNVQDRAIINLIIGVVIPYSIKRWFKSWKIPDQFLGGMYISGWNGLATVIYNMTNAENKNVTVNGLLSNWFGFPTTDLAGSKKGLGQDNYYQLPNGVIVAPLPNGNFIDQQGNVYTQSDLESLYSPQQRQISPQNYQPVLYGEEEDEEEEEIKDFELLMGKLSKSLNSLSGENEGEDDVRFRDGDFVLNGSNESEIILS